MELWDLYDENRNLLGKTHVRGVPLQEGEYHLVTDIWMVRPDGKLLITKRHPKKIWAICGNVPAVRHWRARAANILLPVNWRKK